MLMFLSLHVGAVEPVANQYANIYFFPQPTFWIALVS